MDASKFKILIVDDEEGLREVLGELFSIFNFNVSSASSGNEAWDMLCKEDFDIVVSDIRMPNGNGSDLLKKIKERDLCKPRVFLISGFYDFSLEEVFDMGADGLFAKPFDSSQLRDGVKKALKPLQELWVSSGSFEKSCELNASFLNFSKAAEDSSLKVGRGGFYFKHENPTCEIGDIAAFKIDFEDEFIDSFEGKGRVLWRRSVENDLGAPGVGIEIISLESHCLVKYANWLEQLKIVSYIPKG